MENAHNEKCTILEPLVPRLHDLNTYFNLFYPRLSPELLQRIRNLQVWRDTSARLDTRNPTGL